MIHFHNVRYQNFLAAGNIWTEIQLDKGSNTLVIGENGSGKSTMLDALCFSLFGKPFRKINKPQLLNSVNQKNALVEVEFSMGKNRYKIVRGIRPNILEIYKNNILKDQTASIRDYQEYLENNILKLNYNSFTQIVILGSSSFIPFMQLPVGARREIIEDLLDIKIFTAMNILLKEQLQTNIINLQNIKNIIDLEEEKLNVHESYIKKIKSKNKERIDKIKKEISISEINIVDLNIEIENNNVLVKGLKKTINEEDVRNKISEILTLESKLENKVKHYKKDLKFYEENDECPTCHQDIPDDVAHNIINFKTEKIQEVTAALNELEIKMQKQNEKLDFIISITDKITKHLEIISDSNNQISSLNKYIVQLNENLTTESQGQQNLAEENKKLKEIYKLIKKYEKERENCLHHKQLLDVASTLLKDKGIKTQIVRQYIPVMNKLINKYLAAMEFFVSFELDEQFEETIKSRHRDDFSYGSFSEGEKMRIDLSLLLTWRAIAKMKNSTNTNLLILDEVFDASLDSAGCEEFLKLLNDLGNEKNTNVFVISHKGDVLQDKFRSVIRFEKYKNFSRIAA